jgi:hypothetical protein
MRLQTCGNQADQQRAEQSEAEWFQLSCHGRA